MRKLRRLIHSPNALFAFEATARHLSFTKAAAELNVTQPAVSLSVKRLETALGAKLFHRKHRGVSLTEAGGRLYNDVSIGLVHIRESASRIAEEARRHHVTLSVSTAFANYWMVPRLADFRAANPNVDLRLQTTDKDIDLAAEQVSLAVRRGDGRWPGYHAFPLAREEIVPVASPAYMAAHSAPISTAEMVTQTLIHLEEPFRPRPTWSDWFAAQGVRYGDGGEGLRLNDYALVLQAAIAGEGIAMGWRHVVERLIEQGLLVQVLDACYAKGEAFHVIWSDAAPLSDMATRVRDWLRSQAIGAEGSARLSPANKG